MKEAGFARIRLVCSALLFLLLVLNGRTVRAQTASFGGSVLIDPTEKPLPNAEIVFANLNRSARSDSLGNFLFTGLPFGKHAVVVKMVGYESINTEVTLTGGRPVEVDLLLKPTAQKLAKIDVKAAGPFAAQLVEFEERKSSGLGKYLTAEAFEKADGRPVSAVLVEKIAGLKAVQSNGRRWLAGLRGGKGFSCGQGAGCSQSMEKIPQACYLQVIVNGLVRYNGQASQPMFDIDELNSRDIIGVEFYTTATTPAQYNGTRGENMGACGTVIIWTKGG